MGRTYPADVSKKLVKVKRKRPQLQVRAKAHSVGEKEKQVYREE